MQLECSFGLHFVQCCTDVAAVVDHEIKPQFSKIYPEPMFILEKESQSVPGSLSAAVSHLIAAHGFSVAPAAPPPPAGLEAGASHLQERFASWLIHTRAKIDGNWNWS